MEAPEDEERQRRDDESAVRRRLLGIFGAASRYRPLE
jgi:hypothetical protein